jgi:D-alanyl-lipoteichoic acid acyltransferase DltB (MBOAT superfamily)
VLFQSASFALFLVVVLFVHWTIVNRRNTRYLFLLVASYVFYGSYELWYLSLIFVSTLLDYHCGRQIHASTTLARRRRYLLLSLAGNLGLLCFFKYTDWAIDSIQETLGWLGFDPALRELEYRLLPQALFDTGTARMLVPVGISFYTFQTLSYTIDIYRGNLKPARSLMDFALFVAFFPQLVAGPIVRAIDFLPQLDERPRLRRQDLHEGMYRLGTGLMKKVVIADLIGRYVVDPVYSAPGDYSPLAHALCLYGFAFQIYYDFGGYSDCAIGVARMLGFRLPENFDGPYRSRSVREFWRRWHISLSSWVRDYIFFPLGGSRGLSEAKVVRNLFITMVVIGVWHGASWLWVLYGLLNGAAMSLERWFERRRGGREFAVDRPRSALSWALTFHFIVMTCILIRSPDVGTAAGILTEFGPRSSLHLHGLLALGAGTLLHFLPAGFYPRFERTVNALPTVACGVALGLIGGCVAILVVGETPFIYFQF